jgi:hypothetical protein
MKNIYLLFIFLFAFLGCRLVDESIEPQNIPEGRFQITLKTTGEVVLDDTHLELYEVDSLKHILHFNTAGLQIIRSYIKWDSTQNPPTPNIKELYLKDFTAKFEGKELYSGKFFSLISSMSYNGFVILDMLLITSTNFLTIEMGYPSSGFYQGSDVRNNSALFNYLTSLGKFKKTK